MPIPNANCVSVNKSPDVCDSDEPQTDEQPVQSDTVSYDKGDDLSSLDSFRLGDKTVPGKGVHGFGAGDIRECA